MRWALRRSTGRWPPTKWALARPWPPLLKLAGFALALVGIWLLAKPAGGAGRSRGLRDAVLAGIGFSGFLVFVKFAGPSNQAFWALAVARATPALIIFFYGFVT